ncbi:MAG: hypothetical protein WC593_14620 [Methanoregula sp.]
MTNCEGTPPSSELQASYDYNYTDNHNFKRNQVPYYGKRTPEKSPAVLVKIY